MDESDTPLDQLLANSARITVMLRELTNRLAETQDNLIEKAKGGRDQ